MTWDQAKLQVLVLSGFLLCSFFSGFPFGRDEPRDDPLEVLWCADEKGVDNSYLYLRKEPLIDAIVIPAHHTRTDTKALDVRRFMRRYYPRSYEELTEKYEFVVLWDMDTSLFTSIQLEWMRKAIEEEGLGAMAQKEVYWWASRWAQSVISDAFPNDAEAVVAAGEDWLRKGFLRVIIKEDDPTLPPVLARYRDFLRYQFSYYFTRFMIPKEGSQILAWAKTETIIGYDTVRGTYPFLLGWQYGKGYTWDLGDISFHGGFWGYEYGPDAFFAMLLYSTGREIPKDAVMVHNLRERFWEYYLSKGLIISMVEFVEKFGANTNPLMVKVLAMDERWEEARRQYIRQDYDECWFSFDQLLVDISTFQEEVIKLKNDTLF